MATVPRSRSTLQHLQAIVRYVRDVNCPERISLGKKIRSFLAGGERANPDVVKQLAYESVYFINLRKGLRERGMGNPILLYG